MEIAKRRRNCIYKQARNGYFITAMQGDGGPTDFIHDQKFVLIDKERQIRGYYDGTDKKSVDQLIKDIQMLLVSYIVPMKRNDPKYKRKNKSEFIDCSKIFIVCFKILLLKQSILSLQ